MYNIKVNQALNLVYAEFCCDLTAVQIKEMLIEIEKHKDIPKRLKLLTDYRKVIDVDYNIQHFNSLAHYVNTSFQKKFQHIKWVNITILPSHTASAHYFSQIIDKFSIDYRYVTSIESAIERLELPEIESIQFYQLNCNGGNFRLRK